jgi:hypothetical protein
LSATSPRPPSPGHSTLSGSFFASLLRPLSKAFRSARTQVERADRRYRKFFTRTHLAALVYFHVAEGKSTRSLVRELGRIRPLRRLAHWTPTHLSCVADANNRRDPAAFEGVLAALVVWAKGRVGHRLPPRLRSVLAVDSSFFRALPTMLWARYRHREKGVRAHLAFDPDQRLPVTLILRPGASDERAAAHKMIRRGYTYLMDRGYPGCGLLGAIAKRGAFFLCRLPLDAPLQRLGARKGKRKLDGSIREDSFILYAPGRPDSVAGRLVAVRRRGEEDVFLFTNRMDLEAHEISTLYRQRWGIELFFRWAKSNGADRHWIGRTRNAVVLQLLSRLIAYLLLLLVLHPLTRAVDLPRALLEVVRHFLFLPAQAALRELRAVPLPAPRLNPT